MKANGNIGARNAELTPIDSLKDIAPNSLGAIISAASDITLVIDATAKVDTLMVNEANAGFGNLNHWLGRPLREFLTLESTPKLDAALARLSETGDSVRGVELNHQDNAVWEFPIQYSFHPLDAAGRVLMLGRDLRPVAETQRQLVQAQLALERGYEAQREFDSRYRLLLASVSDGIALVSLSDGRITDMNDRGAEVLGGTQAEYVGAVFASQFENASRAQMETELVNAALSEIEEGVSLRTSRGRRLVRVRPHVFRVGLNRIAICRIEPVDPETTTRPQGIGGTMEALYSSGVEAFVFTDLKGRVRAANERFLGMIEAAHLPDIKGRPLGEFLGRGQVDLSVILENVGRSGHVRLYATDLVGDFGTKTPVELSAARIGDGDMQQVAFVIRDSGRVEAVRIPPPESESATQQNILELVGSASLKEIVAETNDVIEKLCIETAIRLTNNNRVAAAEMLGLSRQSLYVKLRKYGLVKKTDED